MCSYIGIIVCIFSNRWKYKLTVCFKYFCLMFSNNLWCRFCVFFYSLILTYFISFFYIYNHIQFNTISCKQNGKKVEPQVLKLIYGSPLLLYSDITIAGLVIMYYWQIISLLVIIHIPYSGYLNARCMLQALFPGVDTTLANSSNTIHLQHLLHRLKACCL